MRLALALAHARLAFGEERRRQAVLVAELEPMNGSGVRGGEKEKEASEPGWKSKAEWMEHHDGHVRHCRRHGESESGRERDVSR
mmetsp:Transcript_4342/g.9490  ORF Transcript_4342/g.9490 Transcript_4342/m.9490 type:complete len:84 (-) Transcript_4342:2730-2981(-)|eukprot:6190745-Pleurochrysis_carterae.AAC.2